MEAIIRNVRDIDAADRRALEHVLGYKLQENQQVVFQVLSVKTADKTDRHESTAQPSAGLPEWCKVYDGLSDDEIADVESVALRRSDLTRPA